MAKMSTYHAWMVYCRPILKARDVYMSCLDGFVQTHLIYLKWPKCLHVMLGLFSADSSYILNDQDVYMLCLDGLVQTHLKLPRCLHVMLGCFSADPSYILYCQDVYMSCFDGLVQTHLIS